MISLATYSREQIPGELVGNASRTVSFVNDVLLNIPELRFTSGYRSPERNKIVGGVPNSLHVRGLAADFVTSDARYPESLLNRFRSVADRHGFNTYVHDAGSGRHIHSQFRGESSNAPIDAGEVSEPENIDWYIVHFTGQSPESAIDVFEGDEPSSDRTLLYAAAAVIAFILIIAIADD